jgi:hypothetical protein
MTGHGLSRRSLIGAGVAGPGSACFASNTKPGSA